MRCVRGAIAWVIALLLSSCATPGGPIAEPGASTPASPSPSAMSPTPSPSASADWELVRFDHPDGVYSFSYPRGWRVVIDGSSEALRVSVQNFAERANSDRIENGDIVVFLGLTLFDELSKQEGTAAWDNISTSDGLRGRYILRTEEDLDPAFNEGVALNPFALFPMHESVGRMDGITVSMWSGTDAPEIRELFHRVVRSLQVHE